MAFFGWSIFRGALLGAVANESLIGISGSKNESLLVFAQITGTLPETNSSNLKIGRAPKGNTSSNHPCLGAMLVSGRVHGDSDPIVGLNEVSTSYISYIYTTSISKSMSIPPCFPHTELTLFLLEYTEVFEKVSLLHKLGDMLPKTPERYLSLKLCQCQAWPIGINKIIYS